MIRVFILTLLLCFHPYVAESQSNANASQVDTSGMMDPKPKEGDSPMLLIGRKFGLHSAYFPFPGNLEYSTLASASLTNDISDVISFGFERLHNAFKPNKFLSRFVLANVYYYTLLPIHIINDMTRYQWATASRIAATGLKPHFWDLGIDNEVSVYHGASIWALWSAPFRAWKEDSFERAFSIKRYAPVVVASEERIFESEDAERNYSQTKLAEKKDLSATAFENKEKGVSADEHRQLTETVFQDKWNVVRLAAGYNDQSDRARELQDKSYWDECSYLDGSHYLRARLFLPVLGVITTLQKDVHSRQNFEFDTNLSLLENAYAKQGVKLPSSKVAFLSFLSLLGSGSFYKTFRHVHWEYYDKGDICYRAYEWRGIRIPDIVPYLNCDGMSYHLTTGYRISPTFVIPVACEFQIVGDTAIEFSMGGMKRFSNLWNLDVSAMLSFGTGGVEGKLGASIHPFGNIAIEAGLNVYNSEMLEGRRRILSFKNGEIDYEIFTKISLIY